MRKLAIVRRTRVSKIHRLWIRIGDRFNKVILAGYQRSEWNCHLLTAATSFTDPAAPCGPRPTLGLTGPTATIDTALRLCPSPGGHLHVIVRSPCVLVFVRVSKFNNILVLVVVHPSCSRKSCSLLSSPTGFATTDNTLVCSPGSLLHRFIQVAHLLFPILFQRTRRVLRTPRLRVRRPPFFLLAAYSSFAIFIISSPSTMSSSSSPFHDLPAFLSCSIASSMNFLGISSTFVGATFELFFPNHGITIRDDEFSAHDAWTCETDGDDRP